MKYRVGDYIVLNKHFVVPELAGTVGIIRAVFEDARHSYYSCIFPDALNSPLDPTSLYAIMEHCIDPAGGQEPEWEV